MVRREQITTTDDLDGSDGANLVTFAVNGANFEIHLTPDNYSLLVGSVAPFIRAGRSVPPGGRKVNRPRPDPAVTARNRRIRKWAAENQVYVPPTGPIPHLVEKQYVSAVEDAS